MPGCKDRSAAGQKDLVAPGQACIERIIALDDSLGGVRNHACETISLTETIRQYTDAMGRFDYSDCPDAFTKAIQKHRKAWLALVHLVDQYPDLRGEMHDLFEQLENGRDSATFKPLLKTVWDTWGEVERAMDSSQ